MTYIAAIINELSQWIENNLDNPLLSIEMVAQKSGYSKWHLQRIFKQETGYILGNYLRGRRLTRAAIILKMTSIPIQQIALQCGFESQQTFTRAFKQLFNKPPALYRRIDEWDMSNMTLPIGFTPMDIQQPDIIEQPSQNVYAIAESYEFSVDECHAPLIDSKVYDISVNALNNLNSQHSNHPTYFERPIMVYGFLKPTLSHNIFSKPNFHLSFTPTIDEENLIQNMPKHTPYNTIEGKYARFYFDPKIGSLSKLLTTANFNWLPQLGLIRRPGQDIKRINIIPPFSLDLQSIQYEYLIPIY